MKHADNETCPMDPDFALVPVTLEVALEIVSTRLSAMRTGNEKADAKLNFLSQFLKTAVHFSDHLRIQNVLWTRIPVSLADHQLSHAGVIEGDEVGKDEAFGNKPDTYKSDLIEAQGGGE